MQKFGERFCAPDMKEEAVSGLRSLSSSSCCESCRPSTRRSEPCMASWQRTAGGAGHHAGAEMEGVRTRSIRVAGECAAYGRGRLGFLDSSFNRLHAPPRTTLRADSRRADDPGSGRDGPRRGRHGLQALSAREDVGAGAVHAQPLRPRRVCAQGHDTRPLSERRAGAGRTEKAGRSRKQEKRERRDGR